jgi:integrase
MSTGGGTRVHGPYEQPNGRWKIIIHRAIDGRRVTRTFETQESALAEVGKLRAKTSARTIRVSLDAYISHLGLKGNARRSIETTGCRLTGLTRPMLDTPLHDLTPARATQLYEAYARVVAVDTQRNALNQARTWGKWCVRQGYTKVNPWLTIEATGKRRTGKAQLRLDEARKFTSCALEMAEAGDEGATAALTALLLGLRASEVINLVGRDIDDRGKLVWTASKSAAGRRTLEVPAVLQPLLLGRVAGPTARLFNRRREWVRDSVRRVCRACGVPVVTAHGLRGMHATLATEWGVSGHAVSAALGHAGTAVTERHYTSAGSKERASTRKLGELLADSSFLADEHTSDDKKKLND